jgi:2-keto-4-pentenoate hydratase/2-oxohepta-3-ene-1,7-dioic acid hydratase in catechol pathway
MRAPQWALVQYRVPGDARIRLGVLAGSTVVEPPFPAGSLMEALADWDRTADALRAWSPPDTSAVPDARLTAPLTYPGAVLCSGANYYGHATEMGTMPPDADGEPFFFLKPPRTTVIGPGEPIGCPAGARLDWEAELGVVIAHTVKDVPRAEARAHIAGYVVANDISARDRAAREDAVSPHFVYDWLAHKGQDGFCPLGPGVVPAWQVDDPQRLPLRLTVNGAIKQDASTEDMVIGVDRMVAAASALMTLHPGDVILTGTPGGVGAARGEFLAPGDEVVVSIDGVGVLANRVVAA